MTEPKQSKKISRRDAIKLLGAAAGATVLANLPSKWKAPELASGVLPAHAQTSGVLHSLICSAGGSLNGTVLQDPAFSSVQIALPDSGINMDYSIVVTPLQGTANLLVPISPTGTTPTDGTGLAGLLFQISTLVDITGNSSGFVDVTWSFNDPAQGSGVCLQSFAWAWQD